MFWLLVMVHLQISNLFRFHIIKLENFDISYFSAHQLVFFFDFIKGNLVQLQAFITFDRQLPIEITA